MFCKIYRHNNKFLMLLSIILYNPPSPIEIPSNPHYHCYGATISIFPTINVPPCSAAWKWPVSPCFLPSFLIPGKVPLPLSPLLAPQVFLLISQQPPSSCTAALDQSQPSILAANRRPDYNSKAEYSCPCSVSIHQTLNKWGSRWWG